ncbi:hypothetical protein SAMN04487886_12153 [Clostridium sp. DSM 8431]|nr:hypothetical protein SAMN04487886_12153 [Clostridium sp. DSM 8431]
MVRVAIDSVDNLTDRNSYESIIKRNRALVSSSNKTTRKLSSTELEEKYFRDLQKEYSKLNIKKNSRAIHEEDKVSIVLSPELIKKAVKDPEIDKTIRKSLDDAEKYRKSFKANNLTKDGHKVKSVSFFIDRNAKISTSIKINSDIDFKDSSEKELVKSSLTAQFQAVESKVNSETSLYYRYLSLLRQDNFSSEDSFTSLDITV